MSKGLKTKGYKSVDRSKRGRAIKEAIFAMQQIENYLERLRIKGPEKIGDDYYSHFPEDKNLPRQIWGDRITQAEKFVVDEIFAATMAYEDAIFFAARTEEEEK